ncbi:MAG: carbamoyl phosphate synthase large subunit, partial [Rhodospirillaceae bacterium]|nr:carbamoyl phosphate synthase large subunit [Rhodospirillaceae bacterium]
CSLPPYSLSDEVIADIRTQTIALAGALKVVGLMNIQFAVQKDVVFILEVNPRASRTVPFVAKATGVPIAKIAARIMAGEKISGFGLDKVAKMKHVAVKEAVFPFARFPGVDIILGPEMKSTGEVMGLDDTFEKAFAKSQLGAGTRLPLEGTVFLSVKNEDKQAITKIAKKLVDLGFDLIATGGTQTHLEGEGIACTRINKVLEGRPHCEDAIVSGEVQLVINTTEGAQSIADSFSIRRSALTKEVPHYTTMAGADAAAEAIRALKAGTLDVSPLQAYPIHTV